MDNNNGYQTAKAQANALKGEQAEKEEKEIQTKQEVKNQLAELSQDKELAEMYGSSAHIGANNLGGELPLLKIHSTGRSTKNELPSGEEPNNGNFYYKPSQRQFKEIEAHIFTISEGFRAEGLEDGKGEKREIYNQLLGGVIIVEGDYLPFVMYFTGSKLRNLWEFRKEVSKYPKKKPFGIPLFALRVKMTTSQVETKFGKAWVVDFNLMKTETGDPILVMDKGEFQFLKDSAELLNESITNLVASKKPKGEEEVESIDTPASEADAEVVEGDTVSPDDIPF